jgi:hypothetical protein
VSGRFPWVAVLGAGLALAAAGCAELELGCEDLSGMLDGPGGLTVTLEEHPTGWAQPRCFTCHSVEVIHVQNCTGLDEVDLAEIRHRVDDDGLLSCAECHGGNGVGE